jgi:hypothetical protein
LRFFAKIDLYLVLAILLSLFAVAPLGYPGFFQSRSGLLPILNLFDLDANFPRLLGWAPAFGVAHDPLRGDGPLPYLLAEPLRLIGVPGAESIRAIYAISFVLSAATMYALGRRLFGERAAVLAAAAYVYLPYHIATTYLRGALGESLAFGLFPWLLLALLDTAEAPSRRSLAMTALVFAVLVWTQAGLALLAGIFALAFVWAIRPTTSWRSVFASLGLGLVVSLVPLAPIAMRYGFRPATADLAEHLVFPFQLFSAAWGTDTVGPGWTDNLPLSLGIVTTGLALLTLVWRPSPSPANRGGLGWGRATPFLQIAALVLIVLVLPVAAIIWHIVPLGFLLDRPWQLLAFTSLALALLAGSLLSAEPRLAQLAMWAALTAMIVLGSHNYLAPNFLDNPPQRPAPGIFGDDQAALVDYQLQGPLRHGATIHLTLRWQALRPFDREYTVFVHVIDAQGKLWGAGDSIPAQGKRPTTSWLWGEVLEDEHKVQIDVNGPREGYVIEVGLYRPDTGERLLVGGDDKVVLSGEGQ